MEFIVAKAGASGTPADETPWTILIAFGKFLATFSLTTMQKAAASESTAVVADEILPFKIGARSHIFLFNLRVKVSLF